MIAVFDILTICFLLSWIDEIFFSYPDKGCQQAPKTSVIYMRVDKSAFPLSPSFPS